MKGNSKVKWFLGGCLLQSIPLFSQVVTPLLPPAAPGGVPLPPSPAPTTVVRSPVPGGAIPPAVTAPAPPPAAAPDLNAGGLPQQPEEIDPKQEILNFWFGFLPGADFFPNNKMNVWFAMAPDVENQIRSRFFQDVVNAGRGEYNHWRMTPYGRLALILLLDQFPRHLYRNQSQMFMFDRMAQALVIEGMQKGDDKLLYPIERAFFYLPLEHAEDIDLQNLSVAAYRQLLADAPPSIQPQMEDFLQGALIHQQQIAQFGRFPSRNSILGRESTPEETTFLQGPKR